MLTYEVEPPRRRGHKGIRSFLSEDISHRDRSLYFWHYNFGKRGIVADLDEVGGQAFLRENWP